ncbi:MAG: type II toxin-antitoxin system VapC family toxin [Acidobacteriota bacterium]
MNLVDSSGWLEYFADGGNAERFVPAIEQTEELLISTINLYEVFKKVLSERSEQEALKVVAIMQQGKVVEVDASISLSAAKLSVELNLPMADALIYATARAFDAVLWTQDSHFKSFDGVRFWAKRSQS